MRISFGAGDLCLRQCICWGILAQLAVVPLCVSALPSLLFTTLLHPPLIVKQNPVAF